MSLVHTAELDWGEAGKQNPWRSRETFPFPPGSDMLQGFWSWEWPACRSLGGHQSRRELAQQGGASVGPGAWGPLGLACRLHPWEEMGLPHHGMVLASQVGGQLGVVPHALLCGVGQVDFGEGPRANLPGRQQVAIVPTFAYLLHEVLLVQLSLGTTLHGGRGATGGGEALGGRSRGRGRGLTRIRRATNRAGGGPGPLKAAPLFLKSFWDWGRGRGVTRAESLEWEANVAVD